ncbi:MAG: class I SAM-dependent methyltransferase [Pirellulales bacterium]|nr:class I SAM-dependent methyltransferase [Pirellulales bacterium]
MHSKERHTRADARIGFFDRLAHDWDGSEQDPVETVVQVERRAARLELRGGERLLEVGCGTGQLTGWLVERVAPGRVTAVDFSPEMLRKASEKGIGAEFRLIDVCGDELGRAEFDVALCFHSFPHFRDKPAALRNLARALKPRGRLMVMHLDRRDEINEFHRGVGGAIGDDLLPDDDLWREWLAEAGFDPPEISDGGDGFFLLARRGIRTGKAI